MAANRGMSLPNRFWDSPEWAKIFAFQARKASELLKIYEPDVVMRAFREESKTYSLNAPLFPEIVRRLQEETDRARDRAREVGEFEVRDASQAPRPSARKGGGVLGKLKDL